MAAAVEMLKVSAPSPPVPTTSVRSVRCGRTGTTCSRSAVTQPAISAGVSPLVRSATRKPATSEAFASPRMMMPIASWAPSKPRSSRPTSCSR